MHYCSGILLIVRKSFIWQEITYIHIHDGTIPDSALYDVKRFSADSALMEEELGTVCIPLFACFALNTNRATIHIVVHSIMVSNGSITATDINNGARGPYK